MFRFPILLLSLLTNEPEQCVTHCGLRGPGPDCTGLQEAETRFLISLSASVDHWRYERTCKALDGWRVFTHELTKLDLRACTLGFVVGDMCAIGYTHAFSKEVEVAIPEWGAAVIVHELVHAIQIEFGEPVGHCDWKDRGILEAIYRATGEVHILTHTKCVPLENLERLR